MIRGTVNVQLEAIVRLRVRGPTGVESDFDAVVDTGFTSSLTLPSAVVASLGLLRQSGGSVVLDDGTVHHFDVYAAEAEWNGNWCSILVSGIGNEVLLGMRLLSGHALRVAVVPGGLMEIEPMP